LSMMQSSDFQTGPLAARYNGDVEYEDSLLDGISRSQVGELLEDIQSAPNMSVIEALYRDPTTGASTQQAMDVPQPAAASAIIAPPTAINAHTAPLVVMQPWMLQQMLFMCLSGEITLSTEQENRIVQAGLNPVSAQTAIPAAPAGRAAPSAGNTQFPTAGSNAHSVSSILSTWKAMSDATKLENFARLMDSVDTHLTLSNLAAAEGLPPDRCYTSNTMFPKQLVIAGACPDVFLGPYKWPVGSNVEPGGWPSASSFHYKDGMFMWKPNALIRTKYDNDGQVVPGVSLVRCVYVPPMHEYACKHVTCQMQCHSAGLC
jgi:hypothetical protein